MRVAIVVPSFQLSADGSSWVHVPPQGYGGIQWMVANLVDGLLETGHEVCLLGAPGSPGRAGLTVVDLAAPDDIVAWLNKAEIDVVHDHSGGRLDPAALRAQLPFISTHHTTGRPEHPHNCVYLSYAQRAAAGGDGAPVVRIPVNHARYDLSSSKDEYLLFLGRVSPFKGTYEAAAFAHAANRKLIIAGPSWEEEYRHSIEHRFGSTAEFVGEVGGADRSALLSEAAAVMVMSRSVMGPWGALWCEPGATVVSEAAASGTAVIGSDNGCLSEIVPPVGHVIPERVPITDFDTESVLAGLPSPESVRREALARWGHRQVAERYAELYLRVCGGERWN